MKIRNPWLVRQLARASAAVLYRWIRTLEYQHEDLGARVNPNHADLPGRYIYAMWHEYLLLPIFRYPRSDVSVLISQHSDGQWVADACQGLRIPVVRGSSTRGGAEAVRRLVRAGRVNHLALTPDGPLGPRQQVHMGVIYLAARTGLAIVPVGFGLERPWRMRSWDRFAVPRPWSRARCVTGTPIVIPEQRGTALWEHYRQRVQDTLVAVTRAAEAWAATGRRPDVQRLLARDREQVA
jgi:lysophospholipid acyltransferase (LPLAT)-like uncharacterized protein